MPDDLSYLDAQVKRNIKGGSMYVHCPHCDAELHTNLPYCEYCGKNTGYTNTGILTTEYNNKGLVDNTAKQPAKKVPTNDAGEKLQSTEETLKERAIRYGKYTDHAIIAQGIKAIMYNTRSWDECASYQKQSLEMFADKIARILNGDPDYDDSWRDIAGYATLVVEELNKDK